MWRHFGTESVVVVHDSGTEQEQRHRLESHVQGALAFFAVNAPVFEGDQMEISDPRGGTRTVWITKVGIFKTPRAPSMDHIEAEFAPHPPEQGQPHAPTQVIHGDAITVSGNHVNIATRKGSINQTIPVTGGYEDLARAVKQALELLETDQDLDPDDFDAAHEAGAIVLEEIVKPAPDHHRLKRALATLRGVITTATNAAVAAAVPALIQQLVLHH